VNEGQQTAGSNLLSSKGLPSVARLMITELKIRLKNIGYAGAAVIVAVERSPN
jgi:hypothetical protein